MMEGELLGCIWGVCRGFWGYSGYMGVIQGYIGLTEGLYRHDIRISGVVCRGLGSRAGLLEGTRDLVSRCKRDYTPRRS